MDATLVGCHVTPTASILFTQTLHIYKFHQNSLAGECVCVWGGGKLIFTVSAYRYVNIKSVFCRGRSRAEFGLVLEILFCNFLSFHFLAKFRLSFDNI